MRKSQFLIILQAMQAEERVLFQQFADSPFFIKKKRCHQYFIQLCKYSPHSFDLNVDDLKTVYQNVFIQETFSDKRFGRLINELGDLIKQFYVVREALGWDNSDEENNMPSKKLLIQALAKRNAGKEFNRTIDELNKQITSKPAIGTDEYLTLHQINLWRYFHPDTKKNSPKESGIVTSTNYLDCYFYLSKLRDSIELQNRRNIINYKFNALEPGQQQQDTLQASFHKTNPLLNMYKALSDLYQAPDSTFNFQEVKNQYIAVFELLPWRYRRLLMLHLINYGIQRFLMWGIAIEQELLSLYKKGLDSKLLFIDNRLTEKTFSNIAILSIQSGQYNRAEQFIKNYASYLEEELRTDTIAWVQANWYFYQNKIENRLNKAEEQLDKIKNYNLFDLRIRGLKLKIYFERFLIDRDLTFLEHQADAFRNYIKRSHLTPEKKKIWNDLIKIVLLIAKKKNNINHDSLPQKTKQDLHKKIETIHIVSLKKWLVDTIQNL